MKQSNNNCSWTSSHGSKFRTVSRISNTKKIHWSISTICRQSCKDLWMSTIRWEAINTIRSRISWNSTCLKSQLFCWKCSGIQSLMWRLKRMLYQQLSPLWTISSKPYFSRITDFNLKPWNSMKINWWLQESKGPLICYRVWSMCTFTNGKLTSTTCNS